MLFDRILGKMTDNQDQRINADSNFKKLSNNYEPSLSTPRALFSPDHFYKVASLGK